MNKTSYVLTILIAILFQSCGLPSSKQVGLRFSTEKSKLPDSLYWREIGFAKELINQKGKIVVISGGTNPIPLDKWNDFNPSFPYAKNIDRLLLFLHLVVVIIVISTSLETIWDKVIISIFLLTDFIHEWKNQ